jgi:hypothetical protein
MAFRALDLKSSNYPMRRVVTVRSCYGPNVRHERQTHARSASVRLSARWKG